MAGQQELQVHQKREVDKAQEPTTPMRAFLPTTDIFEKDDALTVVLEMPGADRDNIDVSVENGVLTVEGKINFKKYEGLQPVYSEYNVGPYRGPTNSGRLCVDDLDQSGASKGHAHSQKQRMDEELRGEGSSDAASPAVFVQGERRRLWRRVGPARPYWLPARPE